MKLKTIDINIDVGEGIGNEYQLMPHVSSCNIACGGHIGDIQTMRTVVKLAKQNQVNIGAHPSFPDKVNFGRVNMDLSCDDLLTSLKHQVQDLVNVIYGEGLLLHHIKPHGALYNLAAIDNNIAHVIIKLVKSLALPLKLYVPYKSVIADLAIKNNIEIVYEAFADRNYNNDLTLVSRDKKNALIHDPDQLFNHVYNMISRRKVKTIQGSEITIYADTYCVHGDNPEALLLIRHLIEKLRLNDVEIS